MKSSSEVTSPISAPPTRTWRHYLVLCAGLFFSVALGATYLYQQEEPASKKADTSKSINITPRPVQKTITIQEAQKALSTMLNERNMTQVSVAPINSDQLELQGLEQH